MPKARRQLSDAEKGRALERIRAGQPVALVANVYGLSTRTLRDAVGDEEFNKARDHAKMLRAEVKTNAGAKWDGRFNLQAKASTRTWK